MAGDWLKVDIALPNKPEVWQIAEALNLDPDTVVGKLIRVWGWFDQHTENGNAPSVTKKLIDREVGVTGFINALCAVHWMDDKNGSLQVVNFDRHHSKSAKNRALTNDRVKRKRNADAVSKSLPEKRREESITTDVVIEKPRSRKTQLKFETLPDEWMAYCGEKRPELIPLTVWENFRDFYLGHGRAMQDWTRTWQRWVRNEKSHANSQHQPRETAVQRSQRIHREELAKLGYPQDSGDGRHVETDG